MSDEKKVTHPGPDDPEATHWTAGDARRTFQETGRQRPDPRQESDRKRTTASTPAVKRADARATKWEKAPNQPDSRPTQAHQPARAARRTRKARLRLTRVDPWSVMKMSVLLSVALGIAMVVMVAVLWSILSGMGVFDQVDEAVRVAHTAFGLDTEGEAVVYAGTGR